MTYDSWKATEPDRDPAPGEHRTYDSECDCDECEAERHDQEPLVIATGKTVLERLYQVAQLSRRGRLVKRLAAERSRSSQ